MNKQKLFTLLYIVLIVGLLGFMIFMVKWLGGEGRDCVADPIIYFEGKNDGALCDCYQEGVEFRINEGDLITEKYISK